MGRNGRANPQIGARLVLSARTIGWHLRKAALTQLGQGGLPPLVARGLAAVDVQDLAGDVRR
jgi:hypothetical protein